MTITAEEGMVVEVERNTVGTMVEGEALITEDRVVATSTIWCSGWTTWRLFDPNGANYHTVAKSTLGSGSRSVNHAATDGCWKWLLRLLIDA